MENFKTQIQIRWSDLDPNNHLRHSVYYDWGALCRVEFFNAHGLTTRYMQEHQIGPVLFREECVFRKEIHFGNKICIDLQLTRAKKDFSRWSISHSIIIEPDVPAARITVDGAWIDLIKRKLTSAPALTQDVYHAMPKSEDFKWLD